MDFVRWRHRPLLKRPVLVAAFEGWNDAGDAASGAARYLAESLDAEVFASLDPEEFYDFTLVRPYVRLVEGVTRRILWPEPELSAAVVPTAEHDVVFLQAAEPQVRWRTYTEAVAGVAVDLGIELAVTLGALLAEVPHTRPVRVTGTAADEELVRRLGFEHSRYEGPTGIVGVLHDAFGQAGVPSASLWAGVPHYVGKTPSPKATLALVEKASGLLGVPVDTVDLEIASAAYERQINEVVADDEDIAEYVHRLEETDDDDAAPPIVGGDALIQEAERFLREQRGD